MNDTSTGGYMAPIDAPLSRDAVTDLITASIVSLVGLPGSLVRPRWQPEPPAQPPASTNWCALGIQVDDSTETPAVYLTHDSVAQTGTMQRWEMMTALASFYGPAAQDNAELWRDCMAFPQNLDVLRAAGINIVRASQVTAVPDLINVQYINRADVTLTFTRQITRTFAIDNIIAASGTVIDDASDQGSFFVTAP